jgi:hypothetical protein
MNPSPAPKRQRPRAESAEDAKIYRETIAKNKTPSSLPLRPLRPPREASNRSNLRSIPGISAAVLAIVLSVLGTACQSQYNTVLNPLGPVPGWRTSEFYPLVSTSRSYASAPGQGSLLVLTPTGMSYAGTSMYFPHLAYFIESQQGWPVRWVTNHQTRTDEVPPEVPLPVGRYTLVAEADGLGRVKVPIEISNGTLTKVVLQRFRGENDIW